MLYGCLLQHTAIWQANSVHRIFLALRSFVWSYLLLDPSLLVSLAENLMEIVGAVHPDAGQGLQRAVQGAGAMGKALEAITNLAREMHRDSLVPGECLE